MFFKCVVISTFLDLSTGWNVYTLNWGDGFAANPSAFDLNKNRNEFGRGRRHLSSVLALLWPQVVGPVEKGVIEEIDFNEVPKTLLEHRLDVIRRKARDEEEDRLMVRDYLKKLTEVQDEFYGYSYGNSLRSDYT